MKYMKTLLSIVGVGAAAAFVLPTSLAFSTIGGSLGVSANNYQRDFRINNNTPDAISNDDQTPDANYPGALGAVKALWKGGEVWNSDQDGNANFDFEWQGENGSLGGQNDNTVAWESSGICSGGVLAYMDPGGGSGISNGWRIRFCQNWNWNDGTGNQSFDIEGVGAHELGHALGLGHTGTGCGGGCNSSYSTMCPAICGNGQQQRSLGTDDINGVQFIYGNIPANKPVITSLSGSTNIGGTLIINGSNFASTVNVKFTANTTQNSGTIPGVVFNVPSTGGNQISVTIPATALDGNVSVWQPSNSRLSNPVPIDIGSGGGGCNAPVTYGTGELSSQGQVANLTTTGGLPTVGNPTFALLGTGFIPNSVGLLFTGTTQASSALSWGTLWVGGTVVRMPNNIGPGGNFNLPVNVTAGMVGMTTYYTAMARDTAAGNAQGSNGLMVTFCP